MLPWKLCLIALLVCSGVPASHAESGMQEYLQLLDRGISNSEQQLPVMTISAAEASKRFIAGGKIWADGPRDDFTIEAYARAGGLMSLRLLKQDTPQRGDVVLYGGGGALGEADFAKFKEWKKEGVYVIVFAAWPSEAKEGVGDVLIDNGPTPGLKVSENGKEKLCPVDTVLNAVNLWAWTGELAAACTRMGKMPTFYKSVVRPGGRERNGKYTNKTFHDDFTIDPIGTGVLAQKYLDQLRGYLKVVKLQNIKMTQVARWWREDKSDRTLVLTLGHMFPSNLQDSRSPQRPIKSVAEQDPPLDSQDKPDRFVFFIGYQDAPKELVKNAAMIGLRLAYISVGSAEPPAGSSARIIHLNPGWPIDDACVRIEGYDVPILPASGVINASIYWAMVAEACNPEIGASSAAMPFR